MSQDFIERPRKNEKERAIAYVQELLEQAREDRRNDDVDKLENLIHLLNTKKYGLVWEEHAEKVEEEMKTKIPVFVEDEGRKIVGNPESEDYNFLLEGDNLHSLHLLEKTHSGKIDVIYIDPPYNTGNKDFIYNDKFVDKNDGYSHSKWLSFMERRLSIANKLLAKDGLIFISIGDEEFAQLKLLCDEIFGEPSFRDNIMVEISATTGMKVATAKKGGIVKNGEYILVYSKADLVNTNRKPLYDFVPGFDTHFTLFLADNGDILNTIDVLKGEQSIIEEFQRLSNDGERLSLNSFSKYFDRSRIFQNFVIENISKFCRLRSEVPIVPESVKDSLEDRQWIRWCSDKREDVYYLTLYNDKPANLAMMESTYNRTDDFKPIYGRSTIRGDFWKNFWLDMGNIGKEGSVSFKNGKKPLRLIKQLVKWANRPSGIILDFFAGSGSTGHAVSQLNKEDGGNRKYILCTNNENNICEAVTYKRLANIQEGLPHNLKYFKTDFVDKTEFPDVTLESELLNYITPLVELEFGVDISNPTIQIILTEEHLAELLHKGELEEGATLFIHPDVFLDTKEQEQLSELNITLQEIPDYFFGKELWL